MRVEKPRTKKIVSGREATARAANPQSVSDTLTADKLLSMGFRPEAVDLKVVRNDRPGKEDELFLLPAKYSQWTRIREVLGMEPDATIKLFAPQGYTLTEGEKANWLVRRGGRIITAVPHPIRLKALEEAGKINLEPRPVDEPIVFERHDNRWAGRLKSGVVVVPIRGWDPGFNPDKTGESIELEGLMMRPALTACLMIAGPASVIEKASSEDLLIYDEEFAKTNEGPRYVHAASFFVLGAEYTAFELFGLKIIESDDQVRVDGFLDISEFRRVVDVLIERADKWSKRVVLSLLHTDLHDTTYEVSLRLLLGKSGRLQDEETEELIRECLKKTSFEELQEVSEETIREVATAGDWLRGWAKWSEENMQERNLAGLPLLVIPPPLGRVSRTKALIEYAPEAIAQELLDWVYTQTKRKIKPSDEPVAPPDATIPATLTPAELRVLRQMRLGAPKPNLVRPTFRLTGRKAEQPVVKAEPKLEPETAKVTAAETPVDNTSVETPDVATVTAVETPAEADTTLYDLWCPNCKIMIDGQASTEDIKEEIQCTGCGYKFPTSVEELPKPEPPQAELTPAELAAIKAANQAEVTAVVEGRIVTLCPHCDEPISVDPKYLNGITVRCALCNQTFVAVGYTTPLACATMVAGIGFTQRELDHLQKLGITNIDELGVVKVKAAAKRGIVTQTRVMQMIEKALDMVTVTGYLTPTEKLAVLQEAKAE